jgi:hypothetical protein
MAATSTNERTAMSRKQQRRRHNRRRHAATHSRARRSSYIGPFTTSTTKTTDGWAILNSASQAIEYHPTRAAARARRDELNTPVAA